MLDLTSSPVAKAELGEVVGRATRTYSRMEKLTLHFSFKLFVCLFFLFFFSV
jgi:hypothetical protein